MTDQQVSAYLASIVKVAVAAGKSEHDAYVLVLDAIAELRLEHAAEGRPVPSGLDDIEQLALAALMASCPAESSCIGGSTTHAST